MWWERSNRLYHRLVSHHLCTNKKLHVNSVNSKTSRSINGARDGDVGSNIELFVVGQHQLNCRPSCFKLTNHGGAIDLSRSRRFAFIMTQPFEFIVKLIQSFLSGTILSLFLSCMISAALKVLLFWIAASFSLRSRLHSLFHREKKIVSRHISCFPW